MRTAYICAISENELNKVDLAYFKRPLPPVHSLILSDKDANRINKDKELTSFGQPIPNAAANLVFGLPQEDDSSLVNGAHTGDQGEVSNGYEDM